MLHQDSPNLSHLVSNSGPGKRVKVRARLCRKKLKMDFLARELNPRPLRNDEKITKKVLDRARLELETSGL